MLAHHSQERSGLSGQSHIFAGLAIFPESSKEEGVAALAPNPEARSRVVLAKTSDVLEELSSLTCDFAA